MDRKELMTAALKTKDPAKKTLYKTIVGEMDRMQDESSKACISIVVKMIKNNEQNKQTPESVYELELLKELLPKQIDLEKEFKDYIGNALADRSIGGVMKYFKEEFPGRYNSKELSNMARAAFRKDEPKLKSGI